MNHKLEVQITSDPNAEIGKLNPAEAYTAQIWEDAKEGFRRFRWELMPNEESNNSPAFKIFDEAEGLVSVLTCSNSADKYIKYAMTTAASNGSVAYNSVEMVSHDTEESVLGDLYMLRANYLMEQEDHDSMAVDEMEPIAPEDDSSIVDNFVQALLQDAHAHTPKLHYTRQDDTTFVCESFGICETKIVLKKMLETDHSDTYKVSLEELSGTEVLSSLEVSELDVDSDLRELYQLIEQRYPETDKDLIIEDVERFISQMDYQHFLDIALTNAIPIEHTDAISTDKRWLVMDIIKAAPPRVVARTLMEEIIMRKGALPSEESERIRQLVESTIGVISAVRRKPNGFTFTNRGIAIAQDSGSPAANNIPFTSIICAANSWTTWPADVFGIEVDMNNKTTLVRCAVLLLATILAKQLP